jgi:precorrin-6A/cobalt-precorrin-6A reductase
MQARVLILGGTGDARRLAQILTDMGFATVTSLAGVTRDPLHPVGGLRVGSFGGAEGLALHLQAERYGAIVDATHPFAARMSRNAAMAASITGTPLLRLERPPWTAATDDVWIAVADTAAAVSALPNGARALVTIGRTEIAAFFSRADIAGVARMIEAPESAVPQSWSLLLARPPFTEEAEADLMRQYRITHLVTKNAGGPATEAKLDAARSAHIPVIMIERPCKPRAMTFPEPQALAEALRDMLSP